MVTLTANAARPPTRTLAKPVLSAWVRSQPNPTRLHFDIGPRHNPRRILASAMTERARRQRPASDPITGLWNRLRGIGRKVEEELYDFTEEDAEREEEPRGRNTVIALLNAFLTMWKASQANAAERTLGILGFVGLLWFVVVDRGLGFRKWFLGIPAATFAIIWFVPGIIAATWTLTVNLGVENLRRIRTWPLVLVFALTGLIGFRGVFSELARRRLRPLPKSKK